MNKKERKILLLHRLQFAAWVRRNDCLWFRRGETSQLNYNLHWYLN